MRGGGRGGGGGGYFFFFFFFKQKTAYEIKECDWSSDVCSSDLEGREGFQGPPGQAAGLPRGSPTRAGG